MVVALPTSTDSNSAAMIPVLVYNTAMIPVLVYIKKINIYNDDTVVQQWYYYY